MASEYALIRPDQTVDRIEPASRIDPKVQTRQGWKWVPVEEGPDANPSALQFVAIDDVVEASRLFRQRRLANRSDAEQKAAVTAERDRRLATFSFAGKAYDFGGASTVNIVGAGTLALAAIINGAQPSNLRWANPDLDFRWICADNSTVTMDAQTCFAFAQAAAQWKSGHILTGRTIKDMIPIPSDFAANARWPS
jgi:hypothetical protein